MFDQHISISAPNSPLIFGYFDPYSFFVALGILAGLAYYLIFLNRRGEVTNGALKIVAAALVFGTIGSKIPLILEGQSWEQVLYGKSIVGGLVGGMFGVILFKKLFRLNMKLGNVIAPGVALGIGLGRLGCFFGGCCYGIASNWGFDFGDGILRLPTQLFESAFQFIMFGVLLSLQKKVKIDGLLFKVYLLAYLFFRFMIEFIRVNPVVWLSMSVYQIICIFGVVYLSFAIWRERGKQGNM